MKESLFMQGVELMVVGMGTVFLFLTALVIATTLMSRLVGRSATDSAPPAAGPSDEEVAAITAAIARHRRRAD